MFHMFKASLICAALVLSAYATAILDVPRGGVVKVDGNVSPGEWDDAASIPIVVEPGWQVRVRLKHDDENLYFLFSGLRHRNQRMFPELFIDPQNSRTSKWEEGQWWLHVSYNLCEGDGEPNIYRRAGVFLCAHEKPGWEATNPPASDTNDVEIRVSYLKLRIKPTTGQYLGLAVAVTDAKGDANQKWFFWPSTAKVESPNTWSEAVLKN